MISILIVMLGVAGQWGLGIALVCALLATEQHRTRTEILGLGLLLGIAVMSYVAFAWSFVGGSLGAGLSWTLTAAGLVMGFVTWPKKPGFFGKAGLLQMTCAALIGFLFVAAIFQTLLTPQRLWDERAIFGIKGTVLFEDQSIHSADLAHSDFVQGHPRYPLLLPLAEQHLYALLGRVDDRWAKVIPPLLFLGLALSFAGVLSRHIDASQAWLFTALLATMPVLLSANYGILCMQADAPVACFHGAAALYFWDALRRNGWQRDRSIVIASALTAATIFTKDEGIALALVDIIVFIAIQLFQPRSASLAVSRQFLSIFLPLALLAPWFVHRAPLPTAGEMNYFGRMSWETISAGAATLAWSVPHLLQRMFVEVFAWGGQWWLMLATFLSSPRRAMSSPQLFLLGDVLGSIVALLVAGMLAPVVVEDHLGGSSQRFLLQLAPVAVLFAAVQWGTFAPRDEASHK